MTPKDVTDIRLIHAHSLLVDEPFLGGYWAEMEGGAPFWIQYAELLPKVYTTVIKTYKCDNVAVGDTIMFKPHTVLDYYLADGRRIWAMDERAITAVLNIQGWDQSDRERVAGPVLREDQYK